MKITRFSLFEENGVKKHHTRYKTEDSVYNTTVSLSGTVDVNNQISKNIHKRKVKIYFNIKNFSKQEKNDGIYAENIIRIALDGINLNHFHKNHPNVDIGIVNPIENVTKENEIISIKSTINYTDIKTLLSDTKAIKIESLFSYVLYAHYNYQLNYNTYFSPAGMLISIMKYVKENNPNFEDYKKIVNILMYYLMFKNNKKEDKNIYEDILTLINGGEDFIDGNYYHYRRKVLERLTKLKTPISLGICYIVPDSKDEKNKKCIIEKTQTIPLNKFWEELLDKWCVNKYFGLDVKKYLNFEDIKSIYEIGETFPIKITIETGDFDYSSDFDNLDDDKKEEIAKKRSEKATKKLYISTKFKDAEFGDEDKNVFKVFNDMIDILEEKPKLVTKFDNFINDIKNEKE